MAEPKRLHDHRVLYISEIGSLLPKDTLREGNGRKLRSTPVPWLKFRTAADTTQEGTRYAMRRRAVKAREDGFALLCVYDEIFLTYGGDRFAPLRGYLVNYHLRAASTAEIAMEIGCLEAGLVERAIPVLLEVGLLTWRTKTVAEFKAGIVADKTMAPHDDPPDDPDEIRPVDDAPDAERAPRRRTRARAGSAKTRFPRKRPENKAPPLAGGLLGSGSQVASQPGRDSTQETVETGDVSPETAQTGDATAPEPAAQPPVPLPEPGDGKTQKNSPETETPPASPPGQATADQRQPDAPQGTQDVPSGPLGDEPTREGATAGARADVAQPTRSASESASVDPTKTDPGGGKPRPVALGVGGIEHLVKKTLGLLYRNHEEFVLQGRKHQPPQNADQFEACERGCLITAWTAVSMLGLSPAELDRLDDSAERHATATHIEKCKTTRGRRWMMWLNAHMENEFGPRWATARRLARRGASGPP